KSFSPSKRTCSQAGALPGSTRIKRTDTNISPLHHQRFAGGQVVFFKPRLLTVQSVDLEPNEAFRMGLIDLIVDQILHQMSVDPSLDARTAREDSQTIPSLVHEMT